MALSGVCRFASTLPSQAGRTPERPIPYQVLVPPLKQAIDTAMAEFSRANRISTQAPPHSLVAIVNTGNGMLKLILVTRSTPNPTWYPQVTNTKYTIRMNTEPTSPIGMYRLGFLLSSAIGATASHPLNAKMENTTPRNRLGARWKFPGESGAKLTPPGPGSASAVTARAVISTISTTPVMIIRRSETLIPAYDHHATRTRPAI